MYLSNVTKSIEDFKLNINSLHIPQGQIIGLIGSNGSGKSTLAKLVMGIHTADTGSIDYSGLTQQDITMILQRPYLLHDTVYNNIIYPLKLRSTPIEEQKVCNYMTQLGLWNKKEQYALSLSSGERQKLSLIRAFIFRPKFIIMDETCSNLDPETLRLIEEWIVTENQTRSCTFLLISHHLGHIKRICDSIIVMDRGMVVEVGTNKKIFGQCDHEVTTRLIQEYRIS